MMGFIAPALAVIAVPALVVEYIAPAPASGYIASACRVGVASACGRIHRTCAYCVIRGTGSSKIRHASVSGRVHCASVSRDRGASACGRIRLTSASLPHRDARERSASESGGVHLAVPRVT